MTCVGDGGLVGRFDPEVDDHRGGDADDGVVTGVHRVAHGGVGAGGAERSGDRDLPAVGAGRGPGDRVRRAERQVSAPTSSSCGPVRPSRPPAAPSGPVIVSVSMTPRATVTVTGCAGAIPVVPNPGDAVTAATGATGTAGEVVAGAPLEAGGWAVPT